MAYVCIWEYIVKPEYAEVFENTYKYDGAWVKLFKKASGYLGTELLKDNKNKNRFVTVDMWESPESRAEFMKRFADQYKELDLTCEEYTVSENLLGEFNSV